MEKNYDKIVIKSNRFKTVGVPEYIFENPDDLIFILGLDNKLFRNPEKFTSEDKIIYLYLFKEYQNYTDIVISDEKLSKDLGINKEIVKKSLNLLALNRYIEINKFNNETDKKQIYINKIGGVHEWINQMTKKESITR